MTRRLVLVSQRVDDIAERGERRDALDQRWAALLGACGLLPLPVCNEPPLAADYTALPGLAGLLLTGGNDLDALGGDVPEREATEVRLIEAARRQRLPILGVCHGMQLIQHIFGLRLLSVDGHVAARQTIQIDGQPAIVNSYHRYGTTATVPHLAVWARAGDGVVKALRHRHEAITGIMWHPERIQPFRPDDIELIKTTFLSR